MGRGEEISLTEDVVFAQLLLDNSIVGNGDSLSINLGVTAFVDQFSDRLEVGFTVCDVGLDELEHVFGGLGHADKDTIVDLEKTEELQDFTGLGGEFRDTTQSPSVSEPK